jgi:transcriptional regulator with XRE-family HTH domain
MDQKFIGRKIRELRSKMGLTTVTLAKKMKLSQAQISRMETGLQGFRSVTLMKLARALEVPPIYFFVEGEEVSPSKIAEELRAQGLTASKDLRKALTSPAFLKFAEGCAKAMKAHRRNLLKMKKAVDRASKAK